MTLDIIRGTTKKPIAAEALVANFENSAGLDGQLILGYPNLGGDANEAGADAIWVSRQYGPVLFDLVEGDQIGDFESRQADIYRLYTSKLLRSSSLVKRRQLLVHPQVVTYSPASLAGTTDEESIVVSDATIKQLGRYLDEVWLDEDLYKNLLSSVQSVSTIRSPKEKRNLASSDSRGAKLKELEASIATLDKRQHRAVIETVDGVQRIRGLAGSGKTIILALKAAYLHGQHPDWKIAITFYTRALKEQFKNLITKFCVDQNREEPDWNQIHVINAWGGQGGIDRTGMYKIFCDINSATYYDFSSARQKFPGGKEFTKAVNEAISEVSSSQPVYDVILVDEAQDFPPEFLKMCFRMLTEEHRLVYAYDELQNLTEQGLPEPKEIFGINRDGKPLVDFSRDNEDMRSRKDIVLEKCYRNSRPVLVTAHGLGFGTAREPRVEGDIGLVQMFDQPSLWRDIGYHVSDGELVPGKRVRLARSPDSSPKFLESHSSKDDIIDFLLFETIEEQNEWVANSILQNLNKDELRFDDVIVINPNPFTARRKLGPLRELLLAAGVSNHLAGVDSATDKFFKDDSVTFTGINRAKGNEAAMVYVVNSEAGNTGGGNLAVVRNRLFTAITRSKAWVRVCGVGVEMSRLIDEFEAIKGTNFELEFSYPTESERELLRIVHRQTGVSASGSMAAPANSIDTLISAIRRGDFEADDLSADQLEVLRSIVNE